MKATQLPLNISLRDESTFENFYCNDNSELIANLKQFIEVSEEPYAYIWGQAHTGRTHLLEACCHYTSNHNKTIAYIALKNQYADSPDVLQGMEDYDLTCIDDIDHVLNNSTWEEALFHFYNINREQGNQLLISGNLPAAQLDCSLKDLKSRLSWGPCFQVPLLKDEHMLAALQMRAHQRGLELSDEVGTYLMNRFPRNMSQLCALLVQLDQASWISKRKLTIPFIKETLTECV